MGNIDFGNYWNSIIREVASPLLGLSVSKVAESEAVIIVEEGQSEENIADLPVIRQLELDDIDKPRELKKIIQERS